jgi:hypothetical protein
MIPHSSSLGDSISKGKGKKKLGARIFELFKIIDFLF